MKHLHFFTLTISKQIAIGLLLLFAIGCQDRGGKPNIIPIVSTKAKSLTDSTIRDEFTTRAYSYTSKKNIPYSGISVKDTCQFYFFPKELPKGIKGGEKIAAYLAADIVENVYKVYHFFHTFYTIPYKGKFGVLLMNYPKEGENKAFYFDPETFQ